MSTLTFEEDEKFETDAWKQKISDYGDNLKKNNVRQILLIHGTFVGNDPLGLFELIRPINKSIANAFRKNTKALINQLVGDVGNFTEEYVEALGTASSIDCKSFTWKSGNFHHARIKGAVNLAQYLAKAISENKILDHERILLLGHSHAGQLFALLTTFLADDAEAHSLYQIMEQHDGLKADKINLVNHLKIIKTINLDFVTLGTPVRYSWGDYEKSRLMAIVNHRSNVRLSGVLSTRDGDYVQQWGAEGSDASPLPPQIIIANDEFDAVLNKGRDLSLLRVNVKREERRDPKYASGHTVNETVLVNYKDNAPFPMFFLNPFSMPHCVKTLFGHGVYTKKIAMLFNIKIIVNNWYLVPDRKTRG